MIIYTREVSTILKLNRGISLNILRQQLAVATYSEGQLVALK